MELDTSGLSRTHQPADTRAGAQGEIAAGAGDAAEVGGTEWEARVESLVPYWAGEPREEMHWELQSYIIITWIY